MHAGGQNKLLENRASHKAEKYNDGSWNSANVKRNDENEGLWDGWNTKGVCYGHRTSLSPDSEYALVGYLIGDS